MFNNSQRKLPSTALGEVNMLHAGTWYGYRDSEEQEEASRPFRNDLHVITFHKRLIVM
jgi:hypothetical protein